MEGEQSLHPWLRKLKALRRKPEEFWALRDVSLSVERGETVGIIGHNGAGKSTILKLLSNITAPTSGEIAINGRLSALIEVGSGFHQELTAERTSSSTARFLACDAARSRRSWTASRTSPAFVPFSTCR